VNKTFLSLREAGLETGKDKMTIKRAIDSGRLSAVKEGNQWRIEPSELFRVFPAISRNDNKDETPTQPSERRNATSRNTDETSMLRLKLEMRDKQIQQLETERERERAQLNERIDDLSRRLDRADEDRTRLTAVLTHKENAVSEEASEKRGLLSIFKL